ncbi:MAG: hypothetical protein IPG46_14305 [Actinobacteria bacterium]|nr:hypothetical protein [Actinomycetota bacterium]
MTPSTPGSHDGDALAVDRSEHAPVAQDQAARATALSAAEGIGGGAGGDDSEPVPRDGRPPPEQRLGYRFPVGWRDGEPGARLDDPVNAGAACEREVERFRDPLGGCGLGRVGNVAHVARVAGGGTGNPTRRAG